MHDYSNTQLYKDVLMHTFHAKALFLCVYYYSGFRNRWTTLVVRITYMFADINVFTSLSTARIHGGTLP